MTTKKKPAGKEAATGGALEHAAKTIGSALGAIAEKTGIAHIEPKKIGKLVKKAKKRLPRKEKKQATKISGKKTPA